MSTRSVRQSISRARTPQSGSGAKVNVTEARAIIAEAKKGRVTTGESKAVEDLFSTGNLTRGARTEFAKFLDAQSASDLGSLVPKAWQGPLKTQLQSPEFQALEAFLKAESAHANVFPPRAQVFAALQQTPPGKVRVVVIGQDPYPTAGNANGLAFSVSEGMKVPASLKNIYAGLKADLGTATPTSGDLTPWTKEGVLLLNTVLTVREGAPNSHRGKGWEDVTTAILEEVNKQAGPVVFLCFGAQAKAMAEGLVDTGKHTILSTPHPSPLNGHGFVRAVERDHPFTRINEILTASGRGTIDWALP